MHINEHSMAARARQPQCADSLDGLNKSIHITSHRQELGARTLGRQRRGGHRSARRRRPHSLHSQHRLRRRHTELAVALGVPVAEELWQRSPGGRGRAVSADAAPAAAAVVAPIEDVEVLLAQLAARRLTIGGPARHHPTWQRGGLLIPLPCARWRWGSDGRVQVRRELGGSAAIGHDWTKLRVECGTQAPPVQICGGSEISRRERQRQPHSPRHTACRIGKKGSK